jgi:flap endonuclease-1
MGCEDLYEITPSKEAYLSEFSGKTIAIDTAFWFDRYFHAVTKDRFSREEMVVGKKYYISQTLSLLVSIPDLLRNNITPVFFFDTTKMYDNSKADAQIPYLEHSPTEDPTKQFPFLQRSTELVLKYLDISYYEAPRDAEADASKYVKKGEADIVASNDYDTLLYQAPVTIRKEPYSRRWKKVTLKETLEQNNIDYRELLDTAILTGTDEIMGPYKNNVDEAMEKVKTAEDLDEFEEAENSTLRAPSGRVSDEVPSFNELRDIYQNPLISHNLWQDMFDNTDPSISDPNLNHLAIYLSQMLKINDGVVDDLIAPIKQEI